MSGNIDAALKTSDDMRKILNIEDCCAVHIDFASGVMTEILAMAPGVRVTGLAMEYFAWSGTALNFYFRSGGGARVRMP